ncbi:MAG: leucine-rich repeat domain-containing protein [Clostridia bacterium]|nr:leucine-rich repeat domain-containing protein [Clostridia bacterium]
MKKLLSLILAVMMLLPLMSAFSLNAATSGSCGASLNWTLSGSTLTITGSGAMNNYSYFEKAPWYDSRASIKKVVIADGVTTVGNYAFYQCSALTDIDFPSSGLTYIGDEAIRECDSLVTLTLPEGLETIGLIAIAYNPKLESVYIPDSVSRIRNMAFAQCTALKEIDYPDSCTEVEGYIFSGCTAIEKVTLHEGITKIGLGAFEVCESLTSINLPTTLLSIRSSAFAYCKSLTSITVPESVYSMETDIFSNCSNLTVGCYEGSYAQTYCEKYSVAYELVTPHEHSYTRKMTTLPGCVTEGEITYTCECGDSYTEPYPAIGSHVWTDWTVTKEATETEDGEQQRTCRRNCGAVETEIIPALGVEAQLSVSSVGPNLTVSGMADVKDVFIALGDYNTYGDVKANSVVRLTPAKLAGAAEYTYTLKEGGCYTVLVRYNDGTQKFLYEQINVTQPVYTANGLQLTVSNLAGVKVIRTAYGEHKTVSAIKKAEGARAFTAKNDIRGADSYMVQYRNNGKVTVAVQYTDGYTDIYTYEVVQKTPDFKQDGNTVTIGNIDDLYIVRYAKGEYKTSSEIKKAVGSQAIKASAAVDGVITITGLKSGTYTFCVQYSDESYNYYTVVVE